MTSKTLACLFFLLATFLFEFSATSCSVLYFMDEATGNIYVANHEDYWYDVNAFIQIEPSSKNELARLWYGWDKFAQGGINEAGLFFDGAVTPDQEIDEAFQNPNSNLGDDILKSCTNVKEALALLDKRNIGLKNAHMMFGDSSGNAVVIEWIGEHKIITPIENNHLSMTNFLLSDTTKGNYPCYRYNSIEERIEKLQQQDSVSLLELGNALGSAAQTPQEIEDGKIGGTLYSTFINITEMKFYLSYQLDNSKVTQLDLNEVFAEDKKRKIRLK